MQTSFKQSAAILAVLGLFAGAALAQSNSGAGTGALQGETTGSAKTAGSGGAMESKTNNGPMSDANSAGHVSTEGATSSNQKALSSKPKSQHKTRVAPAASGTADTLGTGASPQK